MACRARLPRRKNKLEGSDLRSRSGSFRWCGSHSKKYDSRIPVFPVWKKKNKNISVPNTVMDSALHELKDRIDKDPKYKDVKNWLESLPKI